MKMFAIFTAVSVMASCALVLASQPPTHTPAPASPEPKTAPLTNVHDESMCAALGWHLGLQSWTFNMMSAIEAVDMAHKLGIEYIEFFPGQRLDPESNVKLGPGMPAEGLAKLKKHLADAHVRAVSYGVNNLTKNEKATRAIFQFAKDLGVDRLVVEPAPDAWDLTEKLAKEFQLKVACHNHPKPTTYWNPDTVLANIKDRDPALIGECADVGHWSRSGFDTVECLKKMQGHIFELHFKDVAPVVEGSKDLIDKPWGTGKGNARGMLEEMKRQGFKGCFFIEYEHGSGQELEDNVRRCIAFFDATAKELGGPSNEKK